MDKRLKKDQGKLKLFKKFGYDILRAREQIVSGADLSGTILEVGTGKGHLLAALAQKGLRVVSIDMDRKQQSVARANLKAKRFGNLAKLKIMNAEQLIFKDGTFDGVISVNFLHHAHNPLRCVKEMVRVAKNILVLADLNKKGERIMDKVNALEGHSHPRSKVAFKALKVFLEKSGMRVKTYRGVCETALIARKEE